jgi:hypothetical protein
MRLESSWKDIETTVPGLKNVWKVIKTRHEIRTRSPKTITVTDDYVSPTPWNDCYIGRCYPINLVTMEIGEGRTTSYDFAAYVPDGVVKAVNNIPNGFGILHVCWNDHYRHVVMTLQVAELPKGLKQS